MGFCHARCAGADALSSIIALPHSTTHRNQHMDVAYVSALSALAGSVVGGLTSGYTTWLSQRAQAKAGQLAHDLSRREDLYKDFIVAASKAYGEAS